jgi:hypothetical protein
MFRIPGSSGKDLCDRHLGLSRRDVLRVGGGGLIGMTLNNLLRAQAVAAGPAEGAAASPGWGKAKNIIMGPQGECA